MLCVGDGALRLVSPFSPAIRLGATRVLGIGVRCPESAARLISAEHSGGSDEAALYPPPLSQICGVFLNAIFLDHLDADLDQLGLGEMRPKLVVGGQIPRDRFSVG